MFRQVLVHEGPDVLVTYMAAAGVDKPTVVAGRNVLGPGSPVVWFTFPGAWHDIGRFHTSDGAFTGIYANILTPVEVTRSTEGDTWRTTDLFLDVFITPDGAIHLLDGEELDTAVKRAWVEAATARTAQSEADRIVAAARSGTWPPAVVSEWTLDRARAAAGPPSE